MNQYTVKVFGEESVVASTEQIPVSFDQLVSVSLRSSKDENSTNLRATTSVEKLLCSLTDMFSKILAIS